MVFTKAVRDKAGWNEPSFDVTPSTLAPIVRVGEDGQREIMRPTWGMPTPPAYIKGNYDPGVTNIRNINSPLAALAGPAEPLPFTSFAEPDPLSRAADGVIASLFVK
jgi:hypothetical protein